MITTDDLTHYNGRPIDNMTWGELKSLRNQALLESVPMDSFVFLIADRSDDWWPVIMRERVAPAPPTGEREITSCEITTEGGPSDGIKPSGTCAAG